MPRVRSGLGAVADGPRTNWNPATCNTDNEEGNLFVPGRDLKILPTIRIENFRDGVEDLWYYRMLEKLVKQAEEALLWQRKVHKGASSLFLVIKTPFFWGKSS